MNDVVEEIELYRERRSFDDLGSANEICDVFIQFEHILKEGAINKSERVCGDLLVYSYSIKTRKGNVYVEKTVKQSWLPNKRISEARAKYSAFISIDGTDMVCDNIAKNLYGSLDGLYKLRYEEIMRFVSERAVQRTR